MPETTLLDLPVEILQSISTYLDPVGLSGFSRASRTCRAAARNKFLYNINICFTSIEKLQSDLIQWTKFLDPNAAWN